MAEVPPVDPAPKKPGSRAAKRMETMRAASNAQAVRTVLRVFNGKEDAVLRGVDAKENLLTLARVTNRVMAVLPPGRSSGECWSGATAHAGAASVQFGHL